MNKQFLGVPCIFLKLLRISHPGYTAYQLAIFTGRPTGTYDLYKPFIK